MLTKPRALSKFLKGLLAAAGLMAVNTASLAVPAPTPCVASPTCVSFQASGVVGENRNVAAQAIFELNGDFLDITLTNIGPDVEVPVQLLTGLFFSLLDTSTNTLVNLNPVSATLAAGSVVHFGPDGGGNVGGEFAYEQSTGAEPFQIFGARQGISSAGLFEPFGAANFNGPNLHGPVAVNGMNYGITSVNDNITTGNAQVTGGEPIIQHSVNFRLAGVNNRQFGPGALDLRAVGFNFGTSVNMIPEPSQWALFGLGLLGLVAVRRFAPARAS